MNEFSYLKMNPSSVQDEVELVDPLLKIKKKLDIESALDLVIELNSKINKTEEENEYNDATTWWKKNWIASLDFYLSSIDEPQRKLSVYVQRNPKLIRTLYSLSLGTLLKIDPFMDISSALIERKTHRKFHLDSLPLTIFSSLISIASEIPSSLFSQSLDYYITVFDIEKIPQGIYRYSQKNHLLECIQEGNFREHFRNILCGMATSLTASFVLIMVANHHFLQENLSYNRALRDLYIEAGRIAQFFLIRGTQYKIGGLSSPAMKDSDIVNLLKLDIMQEIPLYTLTMGIIKNTEM